MQEGKDVKPGRTACAVLSLPTVAKAPGFTLTHPAHSGAHGLRRAVAPYGRESPRCVQRPRPKRRGLRGAY